MMVEKKCLLLLAAILLTVSGVVPAASIDWSDAQATSGMSDLIDGTPVAALNGSEFDVTVSGITFVSYNLGSGFTEDVYAANSSAGGITTTGDANFDTLIQSQTYGGGVSTTVPLTGLTDGTSYQVQVFWNEQRDLWGLDSRVMTYGDGLGNNIDLASGIPGGQGDDYGQFAIGSFDADGTTQDLALITNGFGNAHFNAILVMEVTPKASNPSPANGADNVAIDVTLGWDTVKIPSAADPNVLVPNPDLIRHEVYISNGDAADPNVTFLGQVAAGSPVNATASYGPLSLSRSSTYYWRVDEIVPDPNGPGEVAVQGTLWSFETVPSIPVIVSEPADQFVDPEAVVSVDFVVEATNPFFPGGTLTSETDGLAYQWQFDDGSGFVSLAGEMSSTLTRTTDTGDGHEGSYRCEISISNDGSGSAGGTVLSAAAVLTYKKMIAEFKFDDNGTPAVATDTSGYGNDIAIAGATYVNDPEEGWVLSFDGDGDVVTADQLFLDHFNAEINSQVTCSFWVYGGETIATAGNNGIVFWSTTPDATNRFYAAQIPWQDGNVYFNFGRDCCSYRISANIGSGENAKGKWNYFILTRNADTGDAAVYLNGVLINDGNVAHAIEALDSFTIGGKSNDSFDGMLKNFRLYNYEFDEIDVAQAYYDETGIAACLETPDYDFTGPDGEPDCVVNLHDFALFASWWMECGLYPASACDE